MHFFNLKNVKMSISNEKRQLTIQLRRPSGRPILDELFEIRYGAVAVHLKLRLALPFIKEFAIIAKKSSLEKKVQALEGIFKITLCNNYSFFAISK